MPWPTKWYAAGLGVKGFRVKRFRALGFKGLGFRTNKMVCPLWFEEPKETL